MNQSPDMNDYDIEGLALQHSYSQLSPAQQAFVLATLGSREAYERLRRAQQMAGSLLLEESTKLQPQMDLRAMHMAMKASQRKPGRRRFSLGGLLSYSIPVYMAVPGATAVLALAMLIGWPRTSTQVPVRERVVYVPMADTERVSLLDRDELVERLIDSLRDELRKEIAIQVPKSIAQIKRTGRLRQAGEQRRESDCTRTTLPPMNRFVGLDNLPQLAVQKRGKNLAEDSAASRFRTSTARDTF